MVPFLLLAAASAHAGPKGAVATAFDALAGLRGPLESQGWTLTTDRNSAIATGDIYDPRDHQVQVYGATCFDLKPVRAGLEPSMEVDRALKTGGKVKIGLWGVGASVDAKMDATISKARVAEIAVADLKPNEACGKRLVALARAGEDVGSWVVVQSTLTTDLDLKVCGGGDLSVSIPVAGQVSGGTDACRKTSGTSVVLATRPEPLAQVLANARIALPTTGVVVPEPRKRHAEPPCWIERPCLPYVEPSFTVAVGRGTTMGAADNQARASLLGPYEQQREDLVDQLDLEDPPPPVAEEAAVVADRFRDDQWYYSLVVLDRASVQARLETDATFARAALDVPVPDDPVSRIRALGEALPIAEQLVLSEGELAVLKGDAPPSTDPVTERRTQQKRELSNLAVRPPDGSAGASAGTAIERAGFHVAAKGQPAVLELKFTAKPAESRKIQTFTNVTRAGLLELRQGDRLLGSIDVVGTASSESPSRADADAQADLAKKVADGSVGLVRAALGLDDPAASTAEARP